MIEADQADEQHHRPEHGTASLAPPAVAAAASPATAGGT